MAQTRMRTVHCRRTLTRTARGGKRRPRSRLRVVPLHPRAAHDRETGAECAGASAGTRSESAEAVAQVRALSGARTSTQVSPGQRQKDLREPAAGVACHLACRLDQPRSRRGVHFPSFDESQARQTPLNLRTPCTCCRACHAHAGLMRPAGKSGAACALPPPNPSTIRSRREAVARADGTAAQATRHPVRGSGWRL